MIMRQTLDRGGRCSADQALLSTVLQTAERNIAGCSGQTDILLLLKYYASRKYGYAHTVLPSVRGGLQDSPVSLLDRH
jgi:hypothetical protein